MVIRSSLLAYLSNILFDLNKLHHYNAIAGDVATFRARDRRLSVVSMLSFIPQFDFDYILNLHKK